VEDAQRRIADENRSVAGRIAKSFGRIDVFSQYERRPFYQFYVLVEIRGAPVSADLRATTHAMHRVKKILHRRPCKRLRGG
jgi:hypothetical protein